MMGLKVVTTEEWKQLCRKVFVLENKVQTLEERLAPALHYNSMPLHKAISLILQHLKLKVIHHRQTEPYWELREEKKYDE
jgi:hypothetical protein